ncbi:class I adenylate-forming enzyme family protein [Desulfobacter sp.]|uniref:class I adenylate-forming enzyme family protein n=1 Tax=Desulfobacter sp. TaxID=2294 RepID=UPI002579E30D|nr:class I adenylate-forming enzyme family protein [Desulfobacter sp.]
MATMITMTLIEMLEKNLKFCPSKTAIVYEDERISHQGLHTAVARLAVHFLRSGIKKGDRVALMMDKKRPGVVIAFLAVAACGGVAVPVDCNQTDGFIKQLFDIVSPSAVVVTDKMHHRLDKQDMVFDTDLIVVCNGIRSVKEGVKIEDILVDESLGCDLPPLGVESSDTVYLNLTSGTTGFPKCAITTHDNIYWNTKSAVEKLALIPEDRHLCMFPPATHPHELFARALYLGGTMVLTDQISPKSLTRVIEDNCVTAMMAITPIYGNFVKFHKNSDFRFTRLKLAESGGMHLDPITAHEFKERFGFPIVPVWGSTETAGIALSMPMEGERPQGSCGTVNPYYSAKIVDETDNEVTAGDVGEMKVKGPGVCSAYFRNEGETCANYRDGWYYTGDMFYRDEKGYFYFSGRRQGMMKVAGMKVFPIEIEDLLIQHPEIREVAVTKERDPLHGEIPKAIIVLEPGSDLTKKDVRAWCTKKIASYKIPKLIEFREGLPRNPVGKILVNQL